MNSQKKSCFSFGSSRNSAKLRKLFACATFVEKTRYGRNSLKKNWLRKTQQSGYGTEGLRRLLEVIFQEWGGIECLTDPGCNPVLSGGLALRSPTQNMLVEPGCCADLGDSANWREAAGHRTAEWRMLWIGHPWLSVKYQAPWLILSDLHESESPPQMRWAVSPEGLLKAVVNAENELERFAQQISPVLITLGYGKDPITMSRRLVGSK